MARLLVFVILFAFTLLAQAPAPAPKPPEPARVEGVVLSMAGEPIRKANVTLRPLGTSPVPGPSASSPYLTSSDAEGKFSFEKVQPGTYMLSAEKAGFLNTSYGAKPGQRFSPSPPLRVDAGVTLKDLKLAMPPQGVIRGRVLDPDGDPVARVQVRVMREIWRDGKPFPMMAGGASTDESGEYRMAQLAPGSYLLVADPTPFRPFEQGRAADGKTQDETLVTTYYPGVTDRTSAAMVKVELGQELPGIDIRLIKRRVFRISGRVPPSDLPAGTRLRVNLTNANSSGFVNFGSSAEVKDDGTFELTRVQPGSYELLLATFEGRMQTYGIFPVTVGEEDVRDVTLTPQTPFKLEGSVRGAAIAAADRSRVRISLFPAGSNTVVFGAPPQASPLKDDGSFIIENVTGRDYRIQAMGLPLGFYVKSACIGAVDLLAGGLISAPAPLDITLADDAGSVDVVATDEDGKPVVGASVMLRSKSNPARQPDRGTTDQSGRASIRNLPPGDYSAFALSNYEFGEESNPEVARKLDSLAKEVKVSAKAKANAPLRVHSMESLRAN